ncbi:HAD superfamily hydrolase [Niveomyces insectorum RCEF 264]|uniref:HAD superfamily hydrolase n=1 Tax=Niveomyces insectorum RCEF 264 TaxID=1081102 RepID=A0A167UKV8_9HYPO|nr:HAD superfamily hydrolase [Niveomyces insectorum RCEF 264]
MHTPAGLAGWGRALRSAAAQRRSGSASGWTRPSVAARRQQQQQQQHQQQQHHHYSTAAAAAAAPPFAFAFDIDGVLLHVHKPIPGAAAALRFLHRHRIPFILLTNGGGRAEAERVAELQELLGLGDPAGGTLPVLSTDNFVQSHTPFQELLDDVTNLDAAAEGGGMAEKTEGTKAKHGSSTMLATAAAAAGGLRDQTILVTGSDPARIRTLAERVYGFRSVVTPADLVAAYPAIYPFDPLLRTVYAGTTRPLPLPLLRDRNPAGTPDPTRPPRSCAAGVSGHARPRRTDDGGGDERRPRPRPQPAARTSFLLQRRPALVDDVPPAAVRPGRVCGRGGRRVGAGAGGARGPREARLRGARAAPASAAAAAAAAPLRTVYMVGDNPASDIAGANRFRSAHGTDWCSVLVGTGVYNAGSSPAAAADGSNIADPRQRPRKIVTDVAAAVRWALQREGWQGEPF